VGQIVTYDSFDWDEPDDAQPYCDACSQPSVLRVYIRAGEYLIGFCPGCVANLTVASQTQQVEYAEYKRSEQR
jgi:hypothetical protein